MVGSPSTLNAAVAAVIVVSSASADIPVERLADFGLGGSPSDVNAPGVIFGAVNTKGNECAVRWLNRELELPAVSDFESAGLECRGIAIDNLGGTALIGDFDGGSSFAPAVVEPDGLVNIFPAPRADTSVASSSTMSRSGISAGYDDAVVIGRVGINAVAWPNGDFAPLEMAAGQRNAFPGGVGSDGFVIGSAADGVTGRSVRGVWALESEDSELRSASVSEARGQTVELSAERLWPSAANIGHSIAAPVGDAAVGRAITGSTGRARIVFTVPADLAGSRMAVRCIDQNGASLLSVIDGSDACVTADRDRNRRVDAFDPRALLSAWGVPGPADLNGGGVIDAVDMTVLLSGGTG